jgi:hypothetical protein
MQINCKIVAWHKDGVSSNGMIRNIPNFMAWKHIDEKWPEFTNEVCNIKLRFTLDGVNPFGDHSSCHFVWTMALLIYNLPPWLVTKRYFLRWP